MSIEIAARRVVNAWHTGTIFELYEEIKGLQGELQGPGDDNGKVKIILKKGKQGGPGHNPAECDT